MQDIVYCVVEREKKKSEGVFSSRVLCTISYKGLDPSHLEVLQKEC